MKYRVHTFQTFRVAYEMEAESPQEIIERVRDWRDMPEPVDTERTDEEILPHLIIDPLFPDGEVDYNNIIYASMEGDTES